MVVFLFDVCEPVDTHSETLSTVHVEFSSTLKLLLTCTATPPPLLL